MKYTRYDLNNKKRKSERKKMIFSVVGVSVLAIVIATLAAKPLFKNLKAEGNETLQATNKVDPGENTNKGNGNEQTPDVVPNENKDNTNENVVSNGEGETFVMVQCGYYSKKEGADSVKNQLSDKVVAVNVPEGDKFRVIAYIGTEDSANKLAEELTTADISNTKARFFIPKSDTCNAEIIEIINGYLKILDKLKEKDVKGVKTQEFKEWVNKLEEKSDAKNYNIFKELKDGINSLPEEINKDNIEQGYQVVFKVINYFKI